MNHVSTLYQTKICRHDDHSQLIVQLRRVWGVHFARVNARLKLARVHSAQGRGLPTAAGRVCSHTTRARRDTDGNFQGLR